MSVIISWASLIISIIALGISWWANIALKRDEIARALLTEAQVVWGLEEAWILEGPNYDKVKLSELPNLPTERSHDGLWLRKVEVRAILDEAVWNASGVRPFYNFIDSRRTFTVRDELLIDRPPSQPTHQSNYLAVKPHPALISSKGYNEIRGWIERVASAYEARFLSADGIAMIQSYIMNVYGEDRLNNYGPLLSARAQKFLRNQRNK
jgi:hypothetical protein